MQFIEITGYDCGGTPILSIIKLLMTILDAIFILVPILVMLFLVINFTKNIMARDENDMKQTLNNSIKKILFGLVLFLIEPMTHLMIDTLSKKDMTYAKCIEIAIKEDISKYPIKYPEVNINNNKSEKDETNE